MIARNAHEHLIPGIRERIGRVGIISPARFFPYVNVYRGVNLNHI